MVSSERLVDADPATVWAVLGQLDRWAELLPTVDRVVRLGAVGTITVGSRFRVWQPGLLPADYVVTDWRPGDGFSWQAGVGPLRTFASHVLEPVGPATRLRLGVEWSGPGAGLVAALLTSRTRRYLEQEAETFARLAHGDPSGAGRA